MTDKTKVERNALTIPQKYALMNAIVTLYSAAGETDTEFARTTSVELEFPVQPATIKHYREAFGIPQIKAAPVAEMRARIAELEAKLAAAGVEA